MVMLTHFYQERAVPAAGTACRFNFSKWAVSLNSTPPGMERLLPPSDVRWRRDVRFLELGQYEQVCPCPQVALLGRRGRAPSVLAEWPAHSMSV